METLSDIQNEIIRLRNLEKEAMKNEGFKEFAETNSKTIRNNKGEVVYFECYTFDHETDYLRACFENYGAKSICINYKKTEYQNVKLKITIERENAIQCEDCGQDTNLPICTDCNEARHEKMVSRFHGN